MEITACWDREALEVGWVEGVALPGRMVQKPGFGVGKGIALLCVYRLDFFFFKQPFPQKNESLSLLTFGMFWSLGYFLLIFYIFQKPLRNTGFDKHFEVRKSPTLFFF